MRLRVASRSRGLRGRFLLLAFALLGLLIGCGGDGAASVPPADALPDAADFPGWSALAEPQLFDRDTLYSFVNGQAEAFFAYGFEEVAVAAYQDPAGVRLDVEIWRLAGPADAYGLFSANRAGEPAALGNQGDADPGRWLAFWQARYYVRLRARQPLDEAELRRWAEAVSQALPSGGERPVLVDRLPAEGLMPRSQLFFHQEISIQDRLWLGGQNLLGLGLETDGVLARYDLNGVPVQLLLLQYPDTEAALAGLTALREGQVSDLVVAEVQGKRLGAVVGLVSEAEASALLARVLEDE